MEANEANEAGDDHSRSGWILAINGAELYILSPELYRVEYSQSNGSMVTATIESCLDFFCPIAGICPEEWKSYVLLFSVQIKY